LNNTSTLSKVFTNSKIALLSVENGHGETDHSSLYKEIERINKK
jgi:hypothetical protein